MYKILGWVLAEIKLYFKKGLNIIFDRANHLKEVMLSMKHREEYRELKFTLFVINIFIWLFGGYLFSLGKSSSIIFFISKIVMFLLSFEIIFFGVFCLFNQYKKIKCTNNAIFYKELSEILCVLMVEIGLIMITTTLYFKHVKIEYYNNLVSILMIFAIYSFSRYFFVEQLKNWKQIAIFFIFSPFISVLFVFIIQAIANIFTKVAITNEIFLWIILIGSIFLIDLYIYISPKKKRNQAKVALYCIIALFSVISYCFFISDIIAQFLINHGLVNNMEKNEIVELMDFLLRSLTLPYLVGGTIGAFLIEYKDLKEEVI